ncbi:MAG: MFS transporter [Nitriliruptoraceae bacterium]
MPDSTNAPDANDAAPGTPGGEFDRSNVLALSGSHFIHDCYTAFFGVLLPILIPRLGLSFAAAGIVATALRWATSLQPFLGYIADRRDTKWWVILAPSVTALAMSLAGLSPNVAVLVLLLVVAGTSHAAFHPAAGALVTKVSGDRWGKGMSYFMTGGELGRVIGPVAMAALIGAVGVQLSWLIVIPGFLWSYLLWRKFRTATFTAADSTPPRLRGVLREGRTPLVIMSAIIMLRSFMINGLLIFYPTYATEGGASLLIAGLGLTVYEAGGALGAFAAGILSDKFGRIRMLVLGMLVALPTLVVAVALGPTWLGLVMLAIGGLGLISSHSVELVIMQRLLPEHRSSAVGINYLLRAVGGAIAMIAIGAIGDAIGLRNALFIGIAVAAVSLPISFLMRPYEDVDAAARTRA